MQAGVDEAGRGPLAGPVCAAAVVLGVTPIIGLADSKLLSAHRRQALAEEIRRSSQAWGIGWASVAEIDEMNILRATFLAMSRGGGGGGGGGGIVTIGGWPSRPDGAGRR
jgi:ribonuclease HII